MRLFILKFALAIGVESPHPDFFIGGGLGTESAPANTTFAMFAKKLMSRNARKHKTTLVILYSCDFIFEYFAAKINVNIF